MKRKFNKKFTILMISIMVFSLSFAKVGVAESPYKSLKAWFDNIKIYRNGERIQIDPKPFIVNGTTYVPLRELSNIFDKDIGWDGQNKRIDINDKANEDMVRVKKQITEKQKEIDKLKSKVKELEDKLTSKDTISKSTLYNLEKYLYRQYGDYKRMNFDINLLENKDDIKVNIYVDLDYDYSVWNSLSYSEVKQFIQDMVDDIKYEFRDANVMGYIEDGRTGKELVNFHINTKGNLVVDTNYVSYINSPSLLDLESNLNYYYGEYENVDFNIILSGDGDSIKLYVQVDEDYWYDYLSLSDRENYLEKLYNEINYEYSYAKVDGYVSDCYTERKLDFFEFDSRGYVHLK